MSDRVIDIDLTKNTETRVNQVPSNSEVSQFRAKLAQVLDRTLTVDRLEVNLPSDYKGYWCSNDPLSIAQSELRGYKIDTEYASRNGLNDAADGRARIADVIFMVRPMWMHEEEEKLRHKRYVDTHLKDRRKQKEEKDFEDQNKQIGMSPIINSSVDQVTGSQIEESLTKG